MFEASPRTRPTNRTVFEESLSGEQTRPFIPKLRSDLQSHHPISQTLFEFREQEGKENCERRLYGLWKRLPNSSYHGSDTGFTKTALSSTISISNKEAEAMRRTYEDELLGQCSSGDMSDQPTYIGWAEFRKYAETKEAGTMLCLLPSQKASVR